MRGVHPGFVLVLRNRVATNAPEGDGAASSRSWRLQCPTLETGYFPPPSLDTDDVRLHGAWCIPLVRRLQGRFFTGCRQGLVAKAIALFL